MSFELRGYILFSSYTTYIPIENVCEQNSNAAVKLRRCKKRRCSELEKNLHHDTRGWNKKIMVENRICITGLRRSKVLAVRAPLSMLFVACSWYVLSFSSLGLSRGNSIVMIVHDPSRCLFSSSFRPDFKAAATFCCTRMSASVEMRRVVSGAAAALRRSGFASSSFGYSASRLHYMICSCIRRVRMKDGGISLCDVRR